MCWPGVEGGRPGHPALSLEMAHTPLESAQHTTHSLSAGVISELFYAKHCVIQKFSLIIIIVVIIFNSCSA